VGACAEALAGPLAALGVESRFLVGDPGWRADRPDAVAVAERSAEAVLAGLDGAAAVLLHYAGYGYQERGCPTWLVEGLARWKARTGGRLVTLFHEVWAWGPPWRSSFWLFPRQRRLAATVARLSGGIATTLEIYRDLLRPWTRGREVAVMPVVSPVGEPEAVPAFGERRRRIVVFGGAGVRGRTWGRFLPELARAARTLEAEEILDVGPPLDLPAAVGGVPVRALGVLPAAEVGEVLMGSAAGFLAYSPDFLPKSTIFAAYCSHGVLPVCAWERHAGTALPYWKGTGDPAVVAAEAWRWYAGHRLPLQAERFRDLLG
jgi:hypothetical protein